MGKDSNEPHDSPIFLQLLHSVSEGVLSWSK